MKLIKSDKTGNYSVRYKTRTKYVTQSLDTKKLSEAKRIVKEAKIEEIEIAAKIGALQRDAITSIVADSNIAFQDCVREWYEFSQIKAKSGNTIYTQSGLLNRFREEFKIDKLSEVTSKEVSKFVNGKGDEKAESRKQRLSALRSLFQFGLANSYIIKDPCYGVRVDLSKLSHKQKEKKERSPFTKQEYKAMMDYDPPYFMKQAIMLGWWTGLRIIDISTLEWDSWSDKYLTVWTEKQDKRVQLPLDNPLIGGGKLREMMSCIKAEDKKYCFPEWAKLAKDPTKRSRFSVYFRRFLERVEIEGKSFHSFRHSFVTRIKADDYDSSLDKIAKWVGHSNVETTKGYLHETSDSS